MEKRKKDEGEIGKTASGVALTYFTLGKAAGGPMPGGAACMVLKAAASGKQR